MAVLSTLREMSLPYNCYEVGHTWSPFCTDAALKIAFDCMRESLKMYTSLYGLSQIVQKKFSIEACLKTLQSSITSSCFLSFNVFSFVFFFCLLRKWMGKFYYFHCSYLPGFAASFLAILIEKKNRQQALALYVTNVATETLFRMFASRGIVKPIPHSEVLLFGGVMAFFLYSSRKYGYSNDIVSACLRYLIGTEENKRSPKCKSVDNGVPYETLIDDDNHNKIQKIKKIFRYEYFKHHSCPHKDICPIYVSKGFLFNFAIGYGVKLALKILSKPKAFVKNPFIIFKELTNTNLLNSGLFLGGFSGIYKFVSCFLRWRRGRNENWHAIPAGMLAGCSMFVYPSPSLALYLFWKIIERGYLNGMSKGVLPYIPGGILVLYAVSTALLLYAAILEPHHLKPAYLNFLQRVTNNKLAQMNRNVLDIFGTHASKLYQDFFPELDLRYTSHSFQETVLVWLIH
ncbi:transmembrane protein 135-like [Centruroides vittatus]|uniref:transmembrane protein 135-like n=1 Tax=Centruroides vittatus TaxID=120091 RepID=UPI00350ED0B2